MDEQHNLLATVSRRALEDGTLSPEELQETQYRLWRLLGQRAAEYTGGESSSLPVETAEELMKSICFSLGFYLQSAGDTALLKREPMETLLSAAWRALAAATRSGEGLLRQVEETAPPLENRAYRDTLAQLHRFFQQYDFRFFAHAVPSLDYPLCRRVPADAQGVTYACTYLRQLLLENAFCHRFAPGAMKRLVDCYCPDSRELVLNFYEILAANAIGCALLKRPILALHISQEGLQALLGRLGQQSLEGVRAQLEAGAAAVGRALYLQREEGQYLLAAAGAMAPRVHGAAEQGRLDGVFLAWDT